MQLKKYDIFVNTVESNTVELDGYAPARNARKQA